MSSVSQKCGMDKSDRIAVDLKGNVLTCQNVSVASTAPNGMPHRLGSVDRLSEVELNTARSWHNREGCRQCPVLHLCQGSCMFLEGNLWDASCNNAFSDNIVFFAWAFKIMTGYIPTHIVGGRQDREDIWGSVAPARKVIKIFSPKAQKTPETVSTEVQTVDNVNAVEC